jgi:hypothetical protein
MKKIGLPLLSATLWISISEFVRNEFFLKSYWISHYEQLGLTFPTEPINGAVWGIWSFSFALVIFILHKKFKFWELVGLSWFIGFVLMWLVIGNLDVLPFKLLMFAIPLSLIEVYLAALIIDRFSKIER